MGRFGLMRCFSWVKLILQMPRRILHLKLRVITSLKRKNKCKAPSPSSSDDEASDDSSDEDGDVELALLMRKTSKMMSRLNKKGYNYDPKKNKFRTRKSNDNVKKMCYNCGKYGHLSYDCPEPSKFNKKQDDDDNHNKHSKKSHEKKDLRRKGLSREKKISRLFLENGSPMGNPQMKIQVMMNPRRR